MTTTHTPRPPRPHYVYRLLAADGSLLYVGLTSNVANRIASHRAGKGTDDGRTRDFASYTVTDYPDRRAALVAEQAAIRDEAPKLNLKLDIRARTKRPADDQEYQGMVQRMIRAYARRVNKGDVTTLRGFRELELELRRHVDAAARDLHDQGFSWTEIGDELGISRQAARQRFMDRGEVAA